MKVDELPTSREWSDEVNAPAPAASRQLVSSWRASLVASAAVAAGIVVLFGATFWSMVAIWTRSDTYAHGYFIVPISLYVAWTERARIARVSPGADARPLLLMLPLGLGWLGARLGSVLVIEQYFSVAILIVALWAVLGNAAARRLAFPLGFLLMAVPVGEGLLPYLIDATTAFTVFGLRLLGIAVLQQGNQLTLSTGVWSVVEACSGLRYLIACVTIGLPFAYLTYSSWRRRLAFVAASVLVPIVANWFRALMIVLIGHLSGMKYAVGIDHLLYGWVFYAIVMFLLLWVGARFAEPRRGERDGWTPPPAGTAGTMRRSVTVGITALVLAGVWPVWASYAVAPTGGVDVRFALPAEIGSWTQVDAPLVFEPSYVGADVVEGRSYQDGSRVVTLHVAVYGRQEQGAELVSSDNVLLSPDDTVWKQLAASTFEHPLVSVDERVGSSIMGRILVWRWYWVGGELTSSPVWAKVLESGRKLLGESTPGAGIVVYAPTGPDPSDTRRALAELVSAAMPELDRRLREATR